MQPTRGPKTPPLIVEQFARPRPAPGMREPGTHRFRPHGSRADSIQDVSTVDSAPQLPAKVSDIFDPVQWRVVEGFDLEDMTYHRQVERDSAGTVVRLVLPRTAPNSPSSRMSRSTWQRGTGWPSRLSCRQILRTP